MNLLRGLIFTFTDYPCLFFVRSRFVWDCFVLGSVPFPERGTLPTEHFRCVGGWALVVYRLH
jgi:hypothetical protein